MTKKSNLRWTPQCLPQSIVPTITVMYAWVCVCVCVCVCVYVCVCEERRVEEYYSGIVGEWKNRQVIGEWNSRRVKE